MIFVVLKKYILMCDIRYLIEYYAKLECLTRFLHSLWRVLQVEG